MKTSASIRNSMGARFFVAAVFLVTLSPASSRAEATAPQNFDSPEAAVKALIAALKAHNREQLLTIFGSEAAQLIESGDPVADKQAGAAFLAGYEEAHDLVTMDDQALLEIGKDQWPFPIPLSKSERGWSFDSAAGKEEILDRRIGRNELSTMQVCLAYVDAQREYYTMNPDKDPLLHYAQKLASSEGKHDGLYWESKANEPESPLGELMARARAEGYEGKSKNRAYHGYLYRILTAQGASAPDGAYNYLAGDKMIGGFGLVAYPANYGNSGVMTFIVNHHGVVYQKDLGPKTETLAKEIMTFDPDKSWTRAETDDES